VNRNERKQKAGEIRPRKTGAITARKKATATELARPKKNTGSKNTINLLKLMGEESVRGRNKKKLQDVCDLVISEALMGDRVLMKLVWDSVVSKGPMQSDGVAKEKHEININIPAALPAKAEGATITIEGIKEDE